MVIQNMKNIVILKDLPSNMIEEAMVILKDNVKVPKDELELKNKESNTDSILKEAEMIVTNYISKIEDNKTDKTKENNQLRDKCKKLKYSNIFFVLFSIGSVISIILR